jgi:hypothetical protein
MAESREGTGAGDAPDTGRRAASVLERLQARPLLLWIAVLTLTFVAFYAMDHLVMAGQGLPLNLDLTPAQ